MRTAAVKDGPDVRGLERRAETALATVPKLKHLFVVL